MTLTDEELAARRPTEVQGRSELLDAFGRENFIPFPCREGSMADTLSRSSMYFGPINQSESRLYRTCCKQR
eukprot:2705-Heterococcus_DN1.PRE.11